MSHRHLFDPRRDLLVWLLSITHNAVMDQSRLSIIGPALVEAHRDALQSDPGVDLGLRIDLLAALGRLPLDQRVPLLLVSVEQLSNAECAAALGLSIDTVMSRVSRGRAALREILGGRSCPDGVTTLRRVS